MFSAVFGWCARQFSLIVLAIGLCAAVFRVGTSHLVELRWDAIGYHLWTHALLNGDLNFERYRENYGYIGLYESRAGWAHNKYPPGVALLRLPVMTLLVDAKTSAFSRTEEWTILILAALALWGAAFFALRSCRRIGVTGWACHFAVLTGLVGTEAFFWCVSASGYSHPWSILGLAILLDVFLMARAAPDREFAGPAAAIVSLLLVLVRNTNLISIIALAIGFSVWRKRRGLASRRHLLLPLLGALIGMAIHIALNSCAHDRLVFSSYAEEAFLWDRPVHASVLFSFEQGLLVYAPLFAVVVVAGFLVSATRPAAIGFTGVLAGYLFIYGHWHCWTLGGGVAHRGFVELTPLLIPLLGGIMWHSPRPGRMILVAACLVAVWVAASFMAGSFRGTLPWQQQSRETFLNHLIGGHALVTF